MRKSSILFLVSSVAIYALAPMGATHADTETKKTPETSSSGTKDPAGEKDIPMGMMMQGMGMGMGMNMSPEEMKKHHEMMMEHHKMMMNMSPEEMKKHHEMMMKEHQGMMSSDEENTQAHN